MPVYEYECRNCKERFEVLQSIRDDASKIRCPKCQADKPKRVLSLFSSSSSKSASAACAPGAST
jgi:putative FmdB family regulatory protein